MPELGIIFAPWDLPGLKIMLGRMFVGMAAAVAAALLLDWWLDDPGPWPVIAIAVLTILGFVWALHGAAPEIRRMHEESEREFQEFLRSRGRG